MHKRFFFVNINFQNLKAESVEKEMQKKSMKGPHLKLLTVNDKTSTVNRTISVKTATKHVKQHKKSTKSYLNVNI